MSSSSTAAAGSALGGSHAGLAIAATAMALSGTLVLFSLCRSKPQHLVPSSDGASDATAAAPSPRLRPCLSSSEKRKLEKARRGSKKRVRFAADVVDNGAGATPSRAPQREAGPSCAGAAAAAVELRTATMPANREALYRGMLRGRSMLRVACSY